MMKLKYNQPNALTVEDLDWLLMILNQEFKNETSDYVESVKRKLLKEAKR